MARVYLETSFVSACVTKRDDAASVYRRQISADWWKDQRAKHELFVSEEVVAELSHPDFRRRGGVDSWRSAPTGGRGGPRTR